MIKVGVIFGGESVEHEVSIISAVQAMNKLDTEKYDIVPIYIAKDGEWYTGAVLREIDTYKDMDLLKTDGDVKPNDLKNILAKSDMLYDKDRIFIENLLEGKKKKCDSIGSVFTVYTNGDVVACQSFMSKLVIGNIYEKPFNDIVKNVAPFDCPFDGKCNLLCQRRYD